MQPTLPWASLVLAALPPVAALADEPAATTTDTTTLEQRFEQQEQRILILERKLELANETAASASSSAPVIKATANGFSLSSADNSFTIKLRGQLAFDGRYFLDQNTPPTSNTWLMRTLRPYIEGTVGGIYDFRFMPDFGQGKAIVRDAYVAARFRPWFVPQIGKFKGPVGLERLQPDPYARFLEASFPTNLLPNRDVGLQLSGAVLDNRLNYAVGVFNGTVDGGSSDGNATGDTDNDGKRDLEARLFAQPFLNSAHFALRGLGLGIGGTYVSNTGVATSTATNVSNGATTGVLTTVTTTSLLPSYVTPGQERMFSYRSDTAGTGTINEATVAAGVRRRIVPQLYYYYGPFGLLSEYAQLTQQVQRQVDATTLRRGTLQHDAWQVSTSWFLTGEEATYGSIKPRSTFQLGKPGWGAWEIAARYQEIDFDDAAFAAGSESFANPTTSVSAAASIDLGLNWWLNQNFKWQFHYAVTSFTGGAAGGTDRPDERLLTTRFAMIF
jgi:phosphate-selective porin OprO/OprP